MRPRVVNALRAIVTSGLAAFAGCSDPDKEVGRRMPGLQKVVAHLRDKPEGRHSAADVPGEIRPRGLLTTYVDGRGACALEFSSETTIDLNPAFVYVGFDTPDAAAVAREVCGKAALSYRGAFKEPGWYRATGQ